MIIIIGRTLVLLGCVILSITLFLGIRNNIPDKLKEYRLISTSGFAAPYKRKEEQNIYQQAIRNEDDLPRRRSLSASARDLLEEVEQERNQERKKTKGPINNLEDKVKDLFMDEQEMKEKTAVLNSDEFLNQSNEAITDILDQTEIEIKKSMKAVIQRNDMDEAAATLEKETDILQNEGTDVLTDYSKESEQTAVLGDSKTDILQKETTEEKTDILRPASREEEQTDILIPEADGTEVLKSAAAGKEEAEQTAILPEENSEETDILI